MQFRDKYFFLSNFYEAPITMPVDRQCPERGSLTFRNAEAAFQAYKCEGNENAMKPFTCMKGGDAKRAGKTVAIKDINEWNTKRLGVMRDVITAKFTQNPGLAERLVAVTEPIVEDNSWRDTFWGVCNGQGQNHLGNILTEVRQQLL